MRKLVLFSALVVALLACGGGDAVAPNNGVDDVKKACEIRATWAKRTTQECIDCLSIAKAPKCDCPAFQQDFAGKCEVQGRAYGDERNCDFVGDCIGKCQPNDCACVDACYAGRDACRPKAAGLDGCLADVCDHYCR